MNVLAITIFTQKIKNNVVEISLSKKCLYGD